jgi:hypothetical protein
MLREKSMKKLLLLVLISASFTTSARAGNPLDMIAQFRYMLSNGSLQGAFAKELCSCRYVSQLTLEQCLSHSGIPSIAATMMSIDDDTRNYRVVVTPQVSLISIPYVSTAEATFSPNKPYQGCKLTRGNLENKQEERDFEAGQ